MRHSMNYDLDTEEGMSNAVEWTTRLIDQLNDGGTWAVPRSGTLVRVDKLNKRCTLVGLIPDPSIARVLTAAGFRVTDEQFSRPSPWPLFTGAGIALMNEQHRSAPRHVTLDFETDDAMLDAIRYGAGISSIQITAFKTQPKKTTMNEIFDSLEAMIRRIVREEITAIPIVIDDRNFGRGFERYVDNNSGKWTALVKQGVGVPAPMPMPTSLGVLDSAAFAAQLKNFAQLRPVEFTLLVKDAVLDQGWFDDAITAQVVAAGDVSSQEDFEAKFKRMADDTNIVSLVVRDAVESDWFTEHMQDTLIGSDALDDQITKVVSNMSIVA